MTNKMYNPLAKMLSIILGVFLCMLLVSEDRRIKYKRELSWTLENIHLMEQRMNALNTRFDRMLKQVEDERIRMEYPPASLYRKFPTNDELRLKPLRVPLNREDN